MLIDSSTFIFHRRSTRSELCHKRQQFSPQVHPSFRSLNRRRRFITIHNASKYQAATNCTEAKALNHDRIKREKSGDDQSRISTIRFMNGSAFSYMWTTGIMSVRIGPLCQRPSERGRLKIKPFSCSGL